ncbi:hypothetical protein E0Z10_g2272 [Xylaria hypoxylon]|uniref:Uncharacterized protein n=1 Tax=Xylaria hypoxylon TaxID=37992 RepID=A0A4Z0Z4D0_9PEZI|nr:hypothetical protein E0Z10_g2272 [Xylaria hypoxylon]
MAVVIGAAALAAGMIVQGDFLYIFFARNYFPQYKRVARYITGQPTDSQVVPHAGETLIRTEVEGLAEWLATSLKVITITETSTELQTTTIPQITTTPRVIPSNQIPRFSKSTTTTTSTQPPHTTTAEITVTTSTTKEEEEEIIDALPSDLPDCNFPLIVLGASVLELHYNLSAKIDVEKWESAAQQLGEVQRFLDVNEATLIKKHGYEEVQKFHSDLNLLVEKPLKIGCFVLEYLQGTLIQLTKTHVDIKSLSERRATAVQLLRDAELQLEREIRSLEVNSSLPSWAPLAPELQSENCPPLQCFMIGTTSLEAFALNIPQRLLDEVQKLKAKAQYGIWHTSKLLLFQIDPWLKPISFVFAIGFVTFLVVVFLTRGWALEFALIGPESEGSDDDSDGSVDIPPEFEGSQSDDNQSNNDQSDGNRSDGNQSNDNQSDGNQSDGNQSVDN